jgi:hypothetical protein
MMQREEIRVISSVRVRAGTGALWWEGRSRHRQATGGSQREDAADERKHWGRRVFYESDRRSVFRTVQPATEMAVGLSKKRQRESSFFKNREAVSACREDTP